MKLPNVKMPDVKLPNVTLPKVKLPDVKLPDVKLPSVKKPSAKGVAIMAAGVAVAAATATTLILVKKRRAKAAAAQEAPQETPHDTYERAEQGEQVDADYYAAVRNAYDDGPNANPISAPATETPLTEDGKIDVTKLASPEDFCNWEEHGCQG